MTEILRIILFLSVIANVWVCAFAEEMSENAVNQADSLRQRIRLNGKDVESLSKLGLLSLRMVDEKTATECGESLLEIGRNSKNGKREAAVIYGNTILGQVHLMKADHPKALKYLSKARTIAELVADSAALASIYNGLGIYTYQYVGDVPEAILYYHKGAKAAKGAGKTQVYFSLLNNIANAHIELGDTLGLPYARQCYEYAKDNNDHYLHYTSSLSLADNYFLIKDYTRALRYINEAEEELNYINGYQPSILYDMKGRLLGMIGQYAESIKNFQKAKDLASNTKDWYGSFLVNEAEMEVSRDGLAKASMLLDSVVDIGAASEDAHNLLKALGLKSIVAEKSGDYKSALEFERKLNDLAKRTTHLKTMRMMSEAQTRLGLDDMNSELAKQRINSIKHQRNFNMAMMAVVALLLVAGGLYYFTRRLHRLHSGLVNQMRVALQREESLRGQIAELKLSAEEAEDRYKKALSEVAYALPEENGDEQPLVDSGEARSIGDKKVPSGIRSSRSIMDDIEEYFSTQKAYKDCNITRDDIAEAIGSNATYVTRAIQDCYQMNLKQFLNNYRIHEAIKILTDPNADTPLKSLANEIGYSSITSFYNHFKDATGMTPAAYRAASKDGK